MSPGAVLLIAFAAMFLLWGIGEKQPPSVAKGAESGFLIMAIVAALVFLLLH